MPTPGQGHAAAPASGGAEPLVLSWKPQAGLIGLSVINFVLRIFTLGIYHFWGKTEVRRRIWSSVRLNGEPLEYTGTGKELFLGFLVVLAVVILPITLVSVALVLWLGPRHPALPAYQILVYVALAFLIGIAAHRALRYRLARTRWRGIRGGLEGSSVAFGWTFFWTALLIPFTLGWIIPWRAVKLQSLLNNAMRFGNTPFRFEARSGPLYGRFAIAWVGTAVLFVAAAAGFAAVLFAIQGPPRMLPNGQPMPPTPAAIAGVSVVLVVFYLVLGIVAAWYQAATLNHFAAHTSFAGASFKGRFTAWSLIGLVLSNLLIIVFTLGLLAPVAQARSARYFVRRLSIEGTVPVAAIVQRAEDPMRRGEGLAQMFDVDAF